MLSKQSLLNIKGGSTISLNNFLTFIWKMLTQNMIILQKNRY